MQFPQGLANTSPICIIIGSRFAVVPNYVYGAGAWPGSVRQYDKDVAYGPSCWLDPNIEFGPV